MGRGSAKSQAHIEIATQTALEPSNCECTLKGSFPWTQLPNTMSTLITNEQRNVINMNLSSYLSASAILCAALASSASAQSDEKRTTFWILGPFGVEYKLDEAGKTSGTLMLTGALKKEGGSNQLKLGPGVEYMMYPQGGARGIGYGVRAASIGGIGIGPTVAYVTRPRQGVAFRTSLTALFGKDYIPFVFDLGIGFQF